MPGQLTINPCQWHSHPLALRSRRHRHDQRSANPQQRQAAFGQLGCRTEQPSHHSIEGLTSLAAAGEVLNQRMLNHNPSGQFRGQNGALRHITASLAGIHQRPARHRQLQRQQYPDHASASASVHKLTDRQLSPIIQDESGRMVTERFERQVSHDTGGTRRCPRLLQAPQQLRLDYGECARAGQHALSRAVLR